MTEVDFNPRSPWGERREQEIIIRAALEFQSTPSARRATINEHIRKLKCEISIHALREESDTAAA